MVLCVPPQSETVKPLKPHSPRRMLEVDLAQGALIDLGVHGAAVGLLVVHGEVLDAHRSALVLHTEGVLQGEGGGEDRILGQVLIGTAAYRQALDVHGRAEDDILAAEAGFRAHACTVEVGHFPGPGGSESTTGREIGGGVQFPAGGLEAVRDAFLADAERTVGIVHVGDTETFHAGRRHVGLRVQHVDLLFQGHLGDDLVDLLVIDGELVLQRAVRGARERQERRDEQEEKLFHMVIVVLVFSNVKDKAII